MIERVPSKMYWLEGVSSFLRKDPEYYVVSKILAIVNRDRCPVKCIGLAQSQSGKPNYLVFRKVEPSGDSHAATRPVYSGRFCLLTIASQYPLKRQGGNS